MSEALLLLAPPKTLDCGCPQPYGTAEWLERPVCMVCWNCGDHCTCTRPGRAEIFMGLGELERLIGCPKGISVLSVSYDAEREAISVQLIGQGLPPYAEGARPQRVERIYSTQPNGDRTVSYAWGEVVAHE